MSRELATRDGRRPAVPGLESAVRTGQYDRRRSRERRGRRPDLERPAVVLLGGLCLLLLAVSTAAGLEGIYLSLQPDTLTVEPGTYFDLVVHADSTSDPFNGYEMTIAWDSDRIEFVSVQAESLFSEYFNQFYPPPQVHADSVHIYHSIWGGGSVTGPGPISSCTFRALTYGATEVTMSRVWVGLGAYPLEPVITRDALVIVADATSGIGERPEGPAPDPPRVELLSHPATRDSRLRLRMDDQEGGVVRLFDAAGALVQERPVRSGLHEWRSTDLLPSAGSGIYFVTVQTRAGRSVTRLVYLR